MNKKGIVLLSGGLDSVVSLAVLKPKYADILALTFDYSQKSLNNEIKASKSIAEFYNVKHRVIEIPWLKELLNKEEVPVLNENELNDKQITKESMKSVWVPNRNALFINIAACFAEKLQIDDIILGANKEEGETFKDNSFEFIEAINNVLKYSVNTKITVKAPLINMTKEQIAEKGIELNIPFNLIYSCYNGTKKHCGKCESCLRLKRALKCCNRSDIMEGIFG